MTDELTQQITGQQPAAETQPDDLLVTKLTVLVDMLEAKLEQAAKAQAIPADVPRFVSR